MCSLEIKAKRKILELTEQISLPSIMEGTPVIQQIRREICKKEPYTFAFNLSVMKIAIIEFSCGGKFKIYRKKCFIKLCRDVTTQRFTSY